MKIVIAIAAILLFSTTAHADVFTPEQRKEIEKIIAEERAKIRKEVMEELKAKQTATAEIQNQTSSTSAQPTPPQNQTVAGTTEENGDQAAPPAAVPVESQAVDAAIAQVTVDRSLPTPSNTIQIDFKKEKTQASILFGGYFDNYNFVEIPESGTTGPNYIHKSRSWSLALSGPINDETNDASNLITLDGVSSGAKAAFSHSWYRAKTRNTESLFQNLDWESLCTRSKQSVMNCSYSDILAAAESDAELAQAVGKFGDSYFGPTTIITASLKASRSEYSYLTPLAKKESLNDTGWGVGGSFYYVPGNRQSMYGIGVDLNREKKSAKAAILCPISNGQVAVCQQGPLGAPKDNESTTIWGEYRSEVWQFPYSILISHNFDSNENSFNMPIYLLRKTDGPFSGGIRLGWTTKEDFSLGLFITSPFEFGKMKSQ
jgi:hypothetical protein